MSKRQPRKSRAPKAADSLAYFPGCGPWGRERTIQPIELQDGLPSFGYKRGEIINATVAERLCLDDAAALSTPEGMCIGRVFHIDRQGVTLRVECGEDCYHEWAEVTWAGRIAAAAKGKAKSAKKGGA